MDYNMERLNSFFLPYDVNHLLIVWGVMTVFLLLYTVLVDVTGIYAVAWQLWKVYIALIGGLYLLSTIGFLVFHFNAPLMMIILLILAFIIIGDIAVKDRKDDIEKSGNDIDPDFSKNTQIEP